MTPPAPSVLVLGGTGFVGQHVCEKLQRAGWRITVPTRRATSARHIQHLPGLTVVEASVHDDAALARLLPGHQAVINLVAILHGSEAAFERTHVQLPARLARACLNAGVPRLVHVSALGVATDSPSRYQRSKARGEQVLRDSGLELTVLRPSVIFGAGDRFLNLFAQLQSVFPVVPLAGASARFQPVWVEDVADAAVACLRGDTVGKTFDAVGPDIMTLADLVRAAGRYGSRQRPIIPLPMALGRLQAMLMELAPGEPLMSRDNLDAMSVDNVTTGQWPDLGALGISVSGIAAVAPTYLRGPPARSRLLAIRGHLSSRHRKEKGRRN
ncbi:complex I NDUFA9 subunit family protein [Hydrogenophaga sp. PAMC20947]|uniref:complex I NDUFA9 subunit family protein n=1 Tax=Hydrogenophaga sp. PAMC20947 TaxID=2565558 RepID=UPI00109E160F|nr:complex I NDUFA9 subunit family protein [Hydrogenophaga sp. PAMC20947]QCB46973.1 complex I NDUFA9 subunit family protein [Hydrogenophaga sp. PAMC20947]